MNKLLLLSVFLFKSAFADQILFHNGNVSDTINARGISGQVPGSQQVAEQFNISNNSIITGIEFSDVLDVGHNPTSVDFIISTEPFSGTIVDSGSVSALENTLVNTINVAGHTSSLDVFSSYFSLQSFSLSAGAYWLELLNGAADNYSCSYTTSCADSSHFINWGVFSNSTVSTSQLAIAGVYQLSDNLPPSQFTIYGNVAVPLANSGIFFLAGLLISFFAKFKNQIFVPA